jgi:hypothetical protein
MPGTISHVLSATTPDDPNYEIQVKDWNSVHAFTYEAAGSEIIGAFSNDNGVSFGTEAGGKVTASYTQSTHAHTEFVFSNSNGVSFGTNGSTVTATVGTNYAGVGETVGTIAGTDLAMTVNTDGVSIGYPKWITTAALSNHSHGNPTLALTNLSGTTDSNSAGFTLSLSAAAPGGGAGTGFTSTTTAGTEVEATLGAGGLSMAVPAFLTTAALSNHSHGNPTLALTNLSGTTASNSAGLTLSLAAAAPGGGATMSEWCPYPEMSLLTASALGHNSLYFNPIDVPENLNAYRANFFLSVATLISASNNTKSAGWTLSMCLYSRGSGASTERLESILSRSAYMRLSASSNSNVSYSHPVGISDSTAVSSSAFGVNATNASTYGVNSVGGYRVLPFPISSTLTPGRYWMAVAVSSVSANAQGLLAASVVQQLHGSNIAFMPWGTSSKASNASWPQVFAGRGVYSATSGAFPATVALSTDHIRQLATTVVLPFFNVSGYTTATNQL